MNYRVLQNDFPAAWATRAPSVVRTPIAALTLLRIPLQASNAL
jgi:hypothetical protein